MCVLFRVSAAFNCTHDWLSCAAEVLQIGKGFHGKKAPRCKAAVPPGALHGGIVAMSKVHRVNDKHSNLCRS